MVKRHLSQIISLECSMEMQEFTKHLLLPGSGIASTSIPLLVTPNTSNYIKGVNCSITQMQIASYNHFGYTIHPTGADTSHQNRPVTRYHRTLVNYIQAILTGDNLDINFFPYAFYHAIRLFNYFP